MNLRILRCMPRACRQLLKPQVFPPDHYPPQVVSAKERESKRVLAVQRALNAVKAANEEVKNMLQPEISVVVQA